MPDYSVGFFVVPASRINELRDLADQTRCPLGTPLAEKFWRLNRIFQRCQEIAVTAEIVTGDYDPLDVGARDVADSHFSKWLRTNFLDKDRFILDEEQFAKLVKYAEKISLDEFLQWSANYPKTFGEIKPPFMIELFNGFQRAIRSTSPGAHGFVYSNFRHDYRDPPPPEPDEPEDTITAEDGAKRKEMVERRWNARISRQQREWWVDSPHHSRILLGMVAPERVAKLDSEYCAARALISSNKILAGLAMMNGDVVPHIEAALLNPVIEVKEGPVRVHAWLQMELPWDTDQQPRAVCTPEQAIELDQILEERDEDELIESIWEMEVHWTRDLIRETYHRFRAALKGAIERGYGFAWLYDRNE